MDWGEISPLRLAARVVAEGVWVGAHRSRRRGSGVEYGGQRPYVPGDDLRFLDRRSLLKHDRLMVREFETDTDRSLWLCVDASASMAYRGREAPGAKLAYAALLAAALTRVAVATRDPVGLAWLAGREPRPVRPSFGEAAFERVVSSLEVAAPGGQLCDSLEELERATRTLAQRARRGSMIVVLSDLLDLPEGAMGAVAALGASSRVLVVVQVLDPDERDLAFRGKVRLRAMEGDRSVETDADAVRARYLEALERHGRAWDRALQAEGGRLVRACTTDPPADVVRSSVRAVGEARR
jgi:uncharacterized protein (DUF58 family)